jgi:hypothetical protein
MAGESARAQRIMGREKRGRRRKGPPFTMLPHFIQASAAYHGLSAIARALLLEIIRRYNGANNGKIVLSARQAAYELNCDKNVITRASRELGDAKLVQPLSKGRWQGRLATTWQIAWLGCDATGELPRKQWPLRKPYEPAELTPKQAISNRERQQRWREKQRTLSIVT